LSDLTAATAQRDAMARVVAGIETRRIPELDEKLTAVIEEAKGEVRAAHFDLHEKAEIDLQDAFDKLTEIIREYDIACNEADAQIEASPVPDFILRSFNISADGADGRLILA
jgi:thiamine biosynthesis protein ThiC